MQERKGIDARWAERQRKKAVLQLQKRGDPITIELLTPIPNPDVERKKEAQLDNMAQLDDGFIRFDTTSEEEEEEEEEDLFEDHIDPDLFN